MIGDATKGLEAKLDATRIGLEASNKNLEAKFDATNKSLEARFDAQRGQITMFTVLIGVIGLFMTAAVAIAPTLAKLVH